MKITTQCVVATSLEILSGSEYFDSGFIKTSIVELEKLHSHDQRVSALFPQGKPKELGVL